MRQVDRFVAVAFIALSIWLIHIGGVRPLTLLPLLFAVLTGFNLLNPSPVLMRINFRQSPKFRDTYDVTISDAGIRFQTAESNADVKWSFYNRVLETDQVFLLFYAKRLYNLIPLNAFSNDELERFRALLKRKLP